MRVSDVNVLMRRLIKIQDDNSNQVENRKVVSMLLLSFLLRIILFRLSGYQLDLNTYAAWIFAAAENGVRQFYDVVPWHDYPPLNIYLFWVMGVIAKAFSLFGTPQMTFLIKLPSNLFELATASLIYRYVRSKASFDSAFFAATLYAFNPATILNSAIWGQYDGIYTFFLVSSILLLIESKPLFSTVAFALALLTKPQSIALAPILLFVIYRKYGFVTWFKSGVTAAIATLIVVLPFKWSNPISFLLEIYTTGYGGYPYTSLNAFNIWALEGFWLSDLRSILGINFFTLGWTLFLILVLSVVNFYLREKEGFDRTVIYASFLLLFGFFMLPTRIHERYLFPALSMLVLLFPFSINLVPVYTLLTLSCLVNQAYVLMFLNSGRFIPLGDPVVLAFSAMNIVVFAYCLYLTVRGIDKPIISRIKWLP